MVSISKRRFYSLSGEQFSAQAFPSFYPTCKPWPLPPSFYCIRPSPLWESYENRRTVFIWVTAKPLKLITTTSSSLIMENWSDITKCQGRMWLKLLALYYFRRHGMTINFIADQLYSIHEKEEKNELYITAQDQMALWYWKETWRAKRSRQSTYFACTGVEVPVKNQSGHLILVSKYYHTFPTGISSVKEVFKI